MNKRSSWRLRFGVRTLLAGTLLAAVLLGWRSELTRRQHHTLRVLLTDGRYAVTAGPSHQRVRERDLAKERLPEIFGRSWLEENITIIVYNSERVISEEELSALRKLRGLGKLIYTAESSDVELLQQALPNCEVCPLTISHRFQLDVF